MFTAKIVVGAAALTAAGAAAAAGATAPHFVPARHRPILVPVSVAERAAVTTTGVPRLVPQDSAPASVAPATASSAGGGCDGERAGTEQACPGATSTPSTTSLPPSGSDGDPTVPTAVSATAGPSTTTSSSTTAAPPPTSGAGGKGPGTSARATTTPPPDVDEGHDEHIPFVDQLFVGARPAAVDDRRSSSQLRRRGAGTRRGRGRVVGDRGVTRARRIPLPPLEHSPGVGAGADDGGDPVRSITRPPPELVDLVGRAPTGRVTRRQPPAAGRR